VGAGLAHPAAVSDQLDERVRELLTPAARDRHPALLNCHRDHLGHEPGRGSIRPEPGMQHPWCKQPVRMLELERLLKPVTARLQKITCEGCEALPAEAAHGFRAQRKTRRRPELGAEHAEGEVGVREEALEHPGPLWADLLRVALSRAEQERGT